MTAPWLERAVRFMTLPLTRGNRWLIWICAEGTQVSWSDLCWTAQWSLCQLTHTHTHTKKILVVMVQIKFVFVSGVCTVNNLLYVIGGDDGSCNLASVEFYNPNTDKWTLLPTCMSTGRSYAGQRKRLCSKWQTTTFCGIYFVYYLFKS